VLSAWASGRQTSNSWGAKGVPMRAASASAVIAVVVVDMVDLRGTLSIDVFDITMIRYQLTKETFCDHHENY
jgi:hypothetical protein